MNRYWLSGIIFLFAMQVNAQMAERINLWPKQMPNQKAERGPIQFYTDSSKALIKITEVTDPLLEVYRPNGKGNGAAIIISPGGGQKFLAWNLEGTEIAQWLSNLGYTAFLLQYRVPGNQTGALKDLQRAIRIVRSNAKKFDLVTDKIGVMGFSAGGNLSARAATSYLPAGADVQDKIEAISGRPDFALLIYPGSMSTGEDRHLIPEIPVSEETPPVFVFVTADDQYNIPFSLGVQLRKFKIPFEFHVVPKGGHGYGLREGNPAAEAWPSLAKSWLADVLKLKD